MGLDFRRKSGRIFDGSRLIPLGENIKTSKIFDNTFSIISTDIISIVESNIEINLYFIFNT